MSNLHKTVRQDMLKKSSDKFHGVKRHGFPCFLLTIFILKFNDLVFNAFDAVIGDGDAEDIPRKVSQRILPCSHSLAVDNPLLVPNVGIDFMEELSPLHGFSEFGFKDLCQGFCVNNNGVKSKAPR